MKYTISHYSDNGATSWILRKIVENPLLALPSIDNQTFSAPHTQCNHGNPGTMMYLKVYESTQTPPTGGGRVRTKHSKKGKIVLLCVKIYTLAEKLIPAKSRKIRLMCKFLHIRPWGDRPA